MLVEVKKFHRHAHRVLAAPPTEVQTLREFLADGGYSPYFVSHFILPVVSCVWSCGADVAGEYPARYLFTFLEHHGLLSVTGSPTWRTVTGGSRTYVERAVKSLSAVATAVAVRDVPPARRRRHRCAPTTMHRADVRQGRRRHPSRAGARAAGGRRPPTERRVLGSFDYSQATTLLHSDTSVLPRQPTRGRRPGTTG